MKFRALLGTLLLSLLSATLLQAAPALWIDVPFIAQTKDACGSASISMILRYWEIKKGRPHSPAGDLEKIQSTLYSPSARGIYASAMQKYFQDSGYRTFAFQGEWQDLNHHIEQGRPLLVSLRASGARGPLHYVVVVGIDLDRGYVFVNDPAQQKMLRLSREGFESEWNPTHNWTLLVVPPSD